MSAHYSLTCGNILDPDIKTVIITYEGIKNFVKSGRIENFPKKYANPVPVEMRAQMLNTMADCKYKYCITNPNFFSSSYHFDYQINNNKLLVGTCDDINSTEAYLGKVLYVTENERIINDFLDYINYISTCEKTYLSIVSKNILQSFAKERNATKKRV